MASCLNGKIFDKKVQHMWLFYWPGICLNCN